MLCSSIEMMLNYDLKVDPKSGFIQTLCRIPQGSWTQGRKIVQAVDGSSIAAVVSRSNGIMVAVYIYYQDLNLHLKEQVWSPDAGRWVSSEHLLIINVLSRGDSWIKLTGSFDAGVQPQGTPIYAFIRDGEIRVAWRDAKGQPVSANRSIFLRVGSRKPRKGPELLDGRD